jgi:hypothetical protein
VNAHPMVAFTAVHWSRNWEIIEPKETPVPSTVPTIPAPPRGRPGELTFGGYSLERRSIADTESGAPRPAMDWQCPKRTRMSFTFTTNQGIYDPWSVQGSNSDHAAGPTHVPIRGNPTSLNEPFGAHRRKCSFIHSFNLRPLLFVFRSRSSRPFHRMLQSRANHTPQPIDTRPILAPPASCTLHRRKLHPLFFAFLSSRPL